MRNPWLPLIAALALGASNVATAEDLRITRPERVGMSSERLERVADYLQELVDERAAAGFQLVVARRGRVVMQRSIGYADADERTPVTNETLFRIFSMTKPIVTVAMLKLYEQGLYSLDDPLSMFVPEFAELKVFAGIGDNGEMLVEAPLRAPTVHDLFQHTAGFTYGLFGDTPVDKAYLDAGIFTPGPSFKEVMGRVGDIPLLYQPGSRYHYSIASDILAYLVERLSGEDAGAFIRDNVLVPLEMNETMAWVPAERAASLSSVHTHDADDKLIVYEDPPEALIRSDFALQEPVFFAGGAQLISTADDYFRFAQMLLDEGALFGERFLARSSVGLMTSNRLPESIAERRIAPGIGYGFNLSVITDRTLIDYPVSNGEFSTGGLARTHFWSDPGQGLVIVLMSQYVGGRNPDYADPLHRLVHAAIID